MLNPRFHDSVEVPRKQFLKALYHRYQLMVTARVMIENRS